jgi:hypothetical protein
MSILYVIKTVIVIRIYKEQETNLSEFTVGWKILLKNNFQEIKMS